MKNILHARARRWAYDGWALKVKGAQAVLKHTVCTTRAEVRDLQAGMLKSDDLQTEVVKVRVNLEVVE